MEITDFKKRADQKAEAKIEAEEHYSQFLAFGRFTSEQIVHLDQIKLLDGLKSVLFETKVCIDRLSKKNAK